MIFRDEEQRLEYHKGNSLLQMLVHSFEALCYEHGCQVELVDIVSPYSVLVHAGLTDEALDHVVHKTNSLYKRSGSYLSAEIRDMELGLVRLFADSPNSLTELT